MNALSVATYYAQLDLDPIPLERYERHLTEHRWDPAVQRFGYLHEGLRDRGDRAANEAFYCCYYTESLPGLGLWYEVYPRAFFLDLDTKTFPDLARFCEGRSRILDAGCGDGLPLLYLAQQFPNVSFTGMDLRLEALDIVRERAQRLGLRNVTLLERDAFDGDAAPTDRFDAIILRNVVDDTRERGTPFQDAAFDTKRKLRAVRRLATPNARVWVSMTPYLEYSPEFEVHVRQDIRAGNFTILPAQQCRYESAGKTSTHLVWVARPQPETADDTSTGTSEDDQMPEQRCQLCGKSSVEDPLVQLVEGLCWLCGSCGNEYMVWRSQNSPILPNVIGFMRSRGKAIGSSHRIRPGSSPWTK